MPYSFNSHRRLPVFPVIQAALRLYKDNFQSYLGVSFQGTLWGFVSILSIFPILIIGGIVAGLLSVVISGFVYGITVALIVILGIVAWIYMIGYCGGKSLVCYGLISKLAYQILINKPNSVSATRAKIDSSNWFFFWTNFIVGFFLWLIQSGLSLLQSVFIELPSKLIYNQLISSLIILISALVTTTFYAWITVRWSLPSTIIAIEETKKDSLAMIEKSWLLTKGFVSKIFLIMFGATVITIPLFILAIIPFLAYIFSNFSDFLYLITNGNYSDNNYSLIGFAFISLIISFILMFLISIIITPLWQCIKAVIYYDLSSSSNRV